MNSFLIEYRLQSWDEVLFIFLTILFIKFVKDKRTNYKKLSNNATVMLLNWSCDSNAMRQYSALAQGLVLYSEIQQLVHKSSLRTLDQKGGDRPCHLFNSRL